MRRHLLGTAATALVLVLAGCGDTASEVADAPTDPTASPTATASPTDSPSSSPGSQGAVDFQEIALLSQTAAGGQADPNAVRLDSPAQRKAFLEQFEHPGFGTRIEHAITAATVPEGHVLLGAVVSIGCDVPPGVTVTGGPDGWLIYPQEVASPLPECFAPVTTVAVVSVPA